MPERVEIPALSLDPQPHLMRMKDARGAVPWKDWRDTFAVEGKGLGRLGLQEERRGRKEKGGGQMRGESQPCGGRGWDSCRGQ